ncbi:putative receptor protein kinase ZmPK1 [Vitis vinifera]|nr:putative receptor protein kinase ZmPK1 [Vitis vinifera]|eukprot:XP_019077087.1 PREDICTED: putative receptor protein kinase ZmPK1 [Vitis vinifera]
MEACRKICLDDCLCQGFAYRLTGEGNCYAKSTLFNGYKSSNFPGSLYLKLPVDVETSAPTVLNGSDLICESKEVEVVHSSSVYDTASKKMRWVYLYSFASAIGAIVVLFIVSGWWFLFRVHNVPSSAEDGYGPISSPFRRFSYTELKKATNNFKVELGRGGFGAVYKGVLVDERAVAVKKLGDSTQGEGEFWAEVSTIGKIYHMNLVRMWGFCSEGRHRLVVYEHVENLSLDKHLFSTSCLGWKERFNVAVGTARGLAYLHHECLEWVIHCDVKPENILLDNGFEPKIADFVLAKLSQRGGPGSGEFSRIRGTKGYMAPEWAMNLPITAKVDVYCYGVVVLEMVRGIRLSKWVGEDGEEQEAELTRFVRVVKRKIQYGEDNWVEDTVDPRLKGKFSRQQAAMLVEIGISCVEEDRSKRPTMATVVQVLLECDAQVQTLDLE